MRPQGSRSFSFPRFVGSWTIGRNVYGISAGVLITAIAILLFSTLRDGHNWDGDYALYIMHARNIVEHLPYAETGYVYNPQRPIHPAAYPSGLPMLLAPVYFFSGLDLDKMKVVCVSTFILLLIIFAGIARQSLPPAIALGSVALLGLHPFVWNLKDTIFSEFPFMLFCYAALYLIDGLDRMDVRPRRWAIAGAAIALAFAYLTRTIGVMLFPIAFLVALYRSKRILNPASVAIGVAAAIVIGVSVLFPSDVGTYAGYFKGFSGLATAKENAVRDMSAIGELLVRDELGNPWAARGWVAAFLLLALLGWTARVRRGVSVFELFFAGYGLFFIIYPMNVEPSRYLLPIWPLFLLYVFDGAYAAGRALGGAARFGLPALLVAASCALYVSQYARTDFGPIPYSVTDPHARELFEAIKTTVPADAAVLVRKPTIIALFTQRRAAIWPADFSNEELWRYIDKVGAWYIVESHPRLGDAHAEKKLRTFVDRNRSALELVFSNNWFNLYRVSTDGTTGGLGRPSSIE